MFAGRGWIFFAPYRRGQRLSAAAGPYIVDEMNQAQKTDGRAARFETMVRLLETDHLNDQLAALRWLKQSAFVDSKRIAVAGNSFGGIQTVLGAERGSYCAAVASAAAAQTWAASPGIQTLMTRAVRNANAPMFFFQGENDWNLSPSRVLAAVAESAGKPYKVKFYPAFGASKEEGHAFGYFGSSVWADDVFKFLDQNCPKSAMILRRQSVLFSRAVGYGSYCLAWRNCPRSTVTGECMAPIFVSALSAASLRARGHREQFRTLLTDP